MATDSGRLTGSRASHEAPEGSSPSGFDPDRGAFRCVHCGHTEYVMHIFSGHMEGVPMVDCAACGIMHSPPHPESPRSIRVALQSLLEAVEEAIRGGDWVVDGRCDPDLAIYRARSALGLPTSDDSLPVSREALGPTSAA